MRKGKKKKERNESPSATILIRPGRIVGSGACRFLQGACSRKRMICADNRDTWAYVYRPGIQSGFDSSSYEIAGAGAAALPASILHPSSLTLAPSYREREDGRWRIVLPILPSSMTLGDDHREGANVLLPLSLPSRSSFSLPGSLRASSPPMLLLLLLHLLHHHLLPLPRPPPFPPDVAPFFSPPSSSPPPRIPYARVIITAAIRHASLATLCPGESSRRGTTIARESTGKSKPMTPSE